MDRLHIEFDIDLPEDTFPRAEAIAKARAPVEDYGETLGVKATVTIIPAQPAEPVRRTRGPNKPKAEVMTAAQITGDEHPKRKAA